FSWTGIFPRGTTGFSDPLTGQPSFHGWMFPVTAGLRYRTQGARVGFSVGLELGVLLVSLGLDRGGSEGLQRAVLAALQLPVTLEIRAGGGSVFAEARWLQSFNGLDGAANQVSGAVTGVVFAAGYRYAF